MTAAEIIRKYIAFFENKDHKRIPNAPLVPQNDPTTLFTSSGMQPLVSYLLGEEHPMGKRLVNVQNCFRAQDIDEVGDNRHTTFFRMLGNWSLGDYFKKEQIPWFFEFLTKELKLNPNKLYVTVFAGDRRSKKIDNGISKPFGPDLESIKIWKEQFAKCEIEAKELELGNSTFASTIGMQNARIFMYDASKNWWSRAGAPDNMPVGEPGGPDSEVFYEFTDVEHDKKYGKFCHPNCDCGRFLEIGNSVFMEYKKIDENLFEYLPQKNVDFGGGLERLLAATENQQDIFQTSQFIPIIRIIELNTGKDYRKSLREMRIVADHLIASAFIIANNIKPSNKEQGYILRRLIRRSLDHLSKLSKNADLSAIIEAIIEQYKETDNYLVAKFEEIKNTILEEEQAYKNTRMHAIRFIEKRYGGRAEFFETPMPIGDEIKGIKEISADDAFQLYATHGLSPTQIKRLGFTFDDQKFVELMKKHQDISRKGAFKKFAGGLADHSEKTIMGHTATHLLHQALRDVLGNHVYQTGSNITSERVRFDFNFDRNLTVEELKKVEDTVNEKIKENLPVHFEMLPLKKAKEIGAIGLFDEKYEEKVKVYFIGDYSKEFCGGPHVEETSKVGKFSIIKQENIGKGNRRIYTRVN